MKELKDRLEELGLSQYYDAFVSEGFESWEILCDITESDLAHLGVKLGHRRKLQRAIAEARGFGSDRALTSAGSSIFATTRTYKSGDESETESKVGIKTESASPAAGPVAAKRKYRRHPKNDENAPVRPASAYVLFSNQIREEVRGQDMSFADIAKLVGERWQVISDRDRESYEGQANAAKERYYADLSEYKKTPEYAAYQAYLRDFKAKHTPAAGDGKRSKLEPETSTSTRSSSHENPDRSSHRRRVSAGMPDTYIQGRHRAGSSPPQISLPKLSGFSTSSKPTSPIGTTYSNYSSPKLQEQFATLSASPRPASATRERFHDLHSTANLPTPETRMSYGETGPPPSMPPFLSHHSTSSTTSSSGGNVPLYSSYRDLPQRRPRRDSTGMPSLTHEETTLSSDSLPPNPTVSYSNLLLPAINAPKNQRILPNPMQTPGAASYSVDARSQQSPQVSGPTQQNVPEYPPGTKLAALLRAGQLARDADMQDEEQDKHG